MRLAVVSLVLAALGACAAKPPRAELAAPAAMVEPVATKLWEQVATPADQARIAGIAQSWRRALDAVPWRAAARLRAERSLADPGSALELPTPSPGPYHCRLVRFGERTGVATFPPDFCYIEPRDGRLSFTKQTGRNLPNGWLYEDTPTRQVFLGTMGPGRYGDVAAQDVSGVIERVSPFRWRLVLTRAGRGALLDIYELVPVTPAVPGAKPAVPAAE